MVSCVVDRIGSSVPSSKATGGTLVLKGRFGLLPEQIHVVHSAKFSQSAPQTGRDEVIVMDNEFTSVPEASNFSTSGSQSVLWRQWGVTQTETNRFGASC